MAPAAAQEDREWGHSQVVSAAFFCSFSAPDPEHSPSHRRQFSTNLTMVFCMDYSSSGTAAVSVPSMRCNPSGMDCSIMDFPRVPPQKPATAQVPHSTGAQTLPAACSSMGSPPGHNLLQAHPPVLPWGPSQAAGGCLSIMDFHRGCRGTGSYPGLNHCRGIAISAPGPSPTPSSLSWRFAEQFLSHILTPVS